MHLCSLPCRGPQQYLVLQVLPTHPPSCLQLSYLKPSECDAVCCCRGEPPRITRQPADVSLEDGQPLRLEVQAAGTQPLAYQWLR